MTPRVLMGSSGLPGIGGIATVGYERFAQLVADGVEASFVNLLRPGERARLNDTYGDSTGNPERLDNVCDVTVDADGLQALAALIQRQDPGVLLGLGHAATLVLRRASRERPLVFMPGTCRQAQDAVTMGLAPDATSLHDAIAAGTFPSRILHQPEASAVAACDLLVMNSGLMLSMAHHFFPAYTGRIWPEPISSATWTCTGVRRFDALALPFDARDVDVCLVASDWTRPEKNYGWVEALPAALRGASIHVVGRVPFELPGVVHHGFLAERAEMMRILGRARCVASPSIIDAAPGVLYEAATMGCNVVASRNCGNWELCAAELLVDPFTLEQFAAAIRRAMASRVDDHLDTVLSAAGHADFIAILDALASPLVPWGAWT